MKESAYKSAGVDIDAGEEVVERIKPHVKSTFRDGVMGGLGGFGAFFDPKAAGYSDPVLVSSTDGVGTKIKIAIDTNRHDTIGIDLVAMCVNDLIVQGAEPLFFLDYFATGKLDPGTAETVIAGIAEGCRQAGCALIGGETAEMPGMYAPGDYDLAGFTVGAVDRDRMLTGDKVREGDIVLGIASSGLHSNGYSLVRKIAANTQGCEYASPAPFDTQKTLGEAFLVPTRIYVRSIIPLLKKADVHALANITGGGLIENIPRVVPESLCVQLDAKNWELPPLFRWLAAAGNLEFGDMARTLNCGIGMVLICAEDEMAACRAELEAGGETVFEIGRIEPRGNNPELRIDNMESAWAKTTR